MKIKHIICAAVLPLIIFLTVNTQAEHVDTFIIKYNEYGLAHYAEDRFFPYDFADAERVDALVRADALEWYEADREIELPDPIDEEPLSACGETDDTADTWHLDMTEAGAACESGYMGQGIRVAVIDTGVNPHEALGDRLAVGYNYITDTTNTADINGHGTSVAGLIAGYAPPEQIGTAPRAEIVPLKCFSGSSGSSIMICRAILEAVRKYDCDVINLSVCLKDATDAMEEAVAFAEEHGVAVVAAAGNDGSDRIRYPAAYGSVIGVGALKSTGILADCSNFNESVFLTAPGEAVRSIRYNGGYRYCTGTSFSVPMVAGAIADMLSAYPCLSTEDIRDILSRTASDRGGAGYDKYFGWGILSVRGCIEEAVRAPEHFIGLPRETESGTAVSLTNNTDETKECDLYAAGYTDAGTLSSVKKIPLILRPHETTEINTDRTGEYYGYFLFRSGTQEPLAPARRPG